MQEILDATRRYGRDLIQTGKMLFSASPKFFAGLVGVAMVTGVGVPYTLIVLGDLIDALVGARGIGILTSDTTDRAILMLVFILLLVGAAMIFHALRGGARRWCLQLTEFIGVIVLLVVALPVALIRLPLQILVTLVASVYKLGRWRWLIMTIILLAFLINAPVVLEAVVYKEIRIGQFIMFIGTDMLLTLWSLLKLSPYARYH